jgi:hypothetical protein
MEGPPPRVALGSQCTIRILARCARGVITEIPPLVIHFFVSATNSLSRACTSWTSCLCA